jgi:hypothetical protein
MKPSYPSLGNIPWLTLNFSAPGHFSISALSCSVYRIQRLWLYFSLSLSAETMVPCSHHLLLPHFSTALGLLVWKRRIVGLQSSLVSTGITHTVHEQLFLRNINLTWEETYPRFQVQDTYRKRTNALEYVSRMASFRRKLNLVLELHINCYSRSF